LCNALRQRINILLVIRKRPEWIHAEQPFR
jgi:hypothetical protein